MRSSLLWVTALSLISLPLAAKAETFYVTVDADDKVGRMLAYQVKETIAASSRHSLVNNRDEATFSLEIVTLDPDQENVRTTYSLVLLWENKENDLFDYYIMSWVGACGSEKVQSCAKNLASEVDMEIQPIVEAMEKYKKDLDKADVDDFSDLGTY